MFSLKWYKSAEIEYLYWKKNNKAITARIDELLKDMKEHPFEGKGKPEPLKYDLAGHWSRRINRGNRLVYRVQDKQIIIVFCRGHYN